MKYRLIEVPPENINDYVKVPLNDIQGEFAKSLVDLLRQRVSHIFTDAIPLDWIDSVEKEAQTNGYSIMAQRASVNSGERGTRYLIFYLERRLSN